MNVCLFSAQTMTDASALFKFQQKRLQLKLFPINKSHF
jgi:hypothetical protein